MLDEVQLRWVLPSDAEAILEIYAPLVKDTATSFEKTVPSIPEFEERIRTYSSEAPWLVAEIKGQVVGYAYATGHRSRYAYQWNQEVTAYVHQHFRKRGIAKKLYLKIFEILKAMNYCKAIAVITLPNDPSVAFHRALGFQKMGEMKDVGFKFDRWYSTSWWDLDLRDDPIQSPADLRPMGEVKDSFDL